MKGRIRDFLESRTGLFGLLRAFGQEPVPQKYAWLFTLGSATLFAFCVQLATGVFLALYYAPTPDHAHASVSAIQSEIPAGGLVRGLHVWGASAMVVLAVCHLLRVFFMGAYKKPREANWIIGVVLLLAVLAFAFTGYLLPWDQKAYWATVVGTRMAGSAPGIGNVARQLLTGGPRVGAYTLTRFFTFHVIWLPLATAVLIVAHLALLRRHGHAGAPGDQTPRAPFFPGQMARDTAVALTVFLVLVALAILAPPVLERVADPTDASYIPRPEWYFLFLFELLKVFKGRWEPLGTILLPTAGILALFALPFLDRKPERRASRRPVLVAVGTAAVGLVLALTIKGLSESPSNPTALGTSVPPPPSPAALAGRLVYTEGHCAACHGPDGTGLGETGYIPLPPTRDPHWISQHAMESAPDLTLEMVPRSSYGFAAAGYLLAIAHEPLDLSSYPPEVIQGGLVIWRENCRNCHIIGRDPGGTKGPRLAYELGRRDEPWLVAHFKNPRALVPKSKMPDFADLPDPELHAMARYILALR